MVLPGGPAVSAPALVPGAAVGVVGTPDAFVYATGAGISVVSGWTGSASYEYGSASSSILAAIGLPAGATLWQVDFYGYTTTATSQSWYLLDDDSSGGAAHSTILPATSIGPGLIQGKKTFPSGLTLAAGHEWVLDLAGSSSTSGYVGAIFQYTLPTLSLVLITPVRVFDSRLSQFGGPIAAGGSRTINVKNAINVLTGAVTTPNAIPKGAKAVAFNLTVTGTVKAGFVAINPGTGTTVTVSMINWATGGATIANGGVVALGSGTAERQVTLVVGGSTGARTQVIVDITGYYE